MRRIRSTPLFAISAAVTILAGASSAHSAADANWPRWRGPHDSGSMPAGRLPTKWTAEQIAWQAPLPGKGCSTPIVWNDRIYVTAPVDGQDALLAFDHAGKQLWQAKFGSEVAGKHRNGSGSNPSPVTNGKGIFVTFKSGNLAAVNPDGSIRWHLNLVEQFGELKLFWDFGTSPVLTDRDVVIARMHEGDSWLAAFDQQTGKLRWKTARNYETPREVDNSYTTPQVIRHEGRDALLTWGAQHLTAHDATSGQLLWSCGDFNPAATPLWPAVASPVVANDVAVVCFGRADRGIPRLHGIKLGGKGDVTATHKLWQREDTGAFVPTPAVYQGKVYVLSDRGQLDCLDPVSGKTLWSQTFPRASSNFYTSPLIVGGILYASRENGHVYVARVEGEFEVLSEYKFADKIIGSLVPLGNRLLVRGEANLYCIAAP